MRISLNWLREFVDIDPNVDTLAHELTMLGLEIEAIEHLGAGLSHVVVGQIKTIEPHPDAEVSISVAQQWKRGPDNTGTILP